MVFRKTTSIIRLNVVIIATILALKKTKCK